MLDRKQEIAIHKAEKSDVFKPKNRITDPSAKAVSSYVRGSKPFNDFLHKHYTGTVQQPGDTDNQNKGYNNNQELAGTQGLIDTIHLIDDLLKINKLKNDYVLYTGLKTSPAILWDDMNVPTDKPIKIHLPAYTSTSTNFSSSRHHAEKNHVDYTKHTPRNIDSPKTIKAAYPQILRINAPAGTSGTTTRYASGLQSDENEIVLPRGLNIEIDPHPTVFKGSTVWHAKILNHAPLVVANMQTDKD